MNELINKTKGGLKEFVNENPDVAFFTTLSFLMLAVLAVGRVDEIKRAELAYNQRENPALIYEMCGDDLADCKSSTITFCTDFVYAREMSYCAEELTLPIYEPIGEK